MMNKINHQDKQNIEKGSLQLISISASSANECSLDSEVTAALLQGGSIDYRYYDNRTRVIRAKAAHSLLRKLLNRIRLRH